MIVDDISFIKDQFSRFGNCKCVVIICQYNGGKSSSITELIHEHFGEKNTYYVTFLNQNKPGFIPGKNKLQFGEMVQNKIVVFDEIDSEEKIDVETYLKELIEHNFVVILTNPYGSSDNYEKEVRLFKEHEQSILPEETLFILVKQ